MLPCTLHNSAVATHTTSFVLRLKSLMHDVEQLVAQIWNRFQAPSLMTRRRALRRKLGGLDRDTAEMGVAFLRDLDRGWDFGIHRHFGGFGRRRPHPVLHLPRDLPGPADPGAHDIQGLGTSRYPASFRRDASHRLE